MGCPGGARRSGPPWRCLRGSSTCRRRCAAQASSCGTPARIALRRNTHGGCERSAEQGTGSQQPTGQAGQTDHTGRCTKQVCLTRAEPQQGQPNRNRGLRPIRTFVNAVERRHRVALDEDSHGLQRRRRRCCVPRRRRLPGLRLLLRQRRPQSVSIRQAITHERDARTHGGSGRSSTADLGFGASRFAAAACRYACRAASGSAHWLAAAARLPAGRSHVCWTSPKGRPVGRVATVPRAAQTFPLTG